MSLPPVTTRGFTLDMLDRAFQKLSRFYDSEMLEHFRLDLIAAMWDVHVEMGKGPKPTRIDLSREGQENRMHRDGEGGGRLSYGYFRDEKIFGAIDFYEDMAEVIYFVDAMRYGTGQTLRAIGPRGTERVIRCNVAAHR